MLTGGNHRCCVLCLLLSLRGLERDRGSHVKRGVATFGVVLVDPGRDPLAGLGLGGELLQVEQFELNGGMPRLDRGVIQRRAGPAHRLHDVQPDAGGAERRRGVLGGFN